MSDEIDENDKLAERLFNTWELGTGWTPHDFGNLLAGAKDGWRAVAKYVSAQRIAAVAEHDARIELPIPMRLPCPACGELHVDTGEFATKIHHTHACQACGMVWRPAIVPTVGVNFLPGFKNA